jgi:3-methyladenine DNA glycosylase AlkD
MSRTTPKRLAIYVRSALAKAGDARTAARGLTFFKPNDDVRLYGIKSSCVRNIEKEAYGKIREEWSVEDAVAFCDLMSRDTHFEGTMVGVLLLGRFKSQFRKGMLATVKRWITDGRFRNWAAIDGLVTFVPLARKGMQLDRAYMIVEDLLDDVHDLMHKACGWLLRETGKADARRLEQFLLIHGPRIPRTTVRYAIERFPQRKRKSLLVKTRG